MNLDTSLALIAQRFGFDADLLKLFASEDTLGGYHSNPALAKWPMGSLWEVEAKTLYALVRALRPFSVLEIGTHRGASATHMAAACVRNREEWGGETLPAVTGRVYGCDLGDYGGDLIPEKYRPYIEVLHVNGVDYLADQPDNTFGLIFEDASHDAVTSEAVARLAQRKLTPGGVLAVHDAAHFLVGRDIRAGLDAAQLPGGYGVYLCDPSDCGLAIWRKAPPSKDEEFAAALEADRQEGMLPTVVTVEVKPDEPKTVRKRAPDKAKRTLIKDYSELALQIEKDREGEPDYVEISDIPKPSASKVKRAPDKVKRTRKKAENG